MFRIQKSDEPISWPVTVKIPKDEGKTVKATFTAKFKLLPEDEQATVSAQGDSDFIAAVLIGWDGVQDEAGNDLQFSNEARDQLAKISYVKTAIISAYFSCANGVAAKN